MRTTSITGMARLGDAMRHATVWYETDVSTGQRVYTCRTKGGKVFNPWNAQWRTLRENRSNAGDAIEQDGRLSEAGPSLFAYSAVSITRRDGTLIGEEEPFDAFVKHMLRVGGDSTWHGETAADRKVHAAEMLAQTSWTE